MKKIILFLGIILPSLLFSQDQFSIETVLQKGHSKQVETIAFSPNGKLIATGSFDHSIKIWDVATGKEIRSFDNHTASIHSLQFSKDGKRILSAAKDNLVCIFDIVSNQIVQTFSIPKTRIIQAVYSPLENYVLIKNESSSLYLMNTLTGDLKEKYNTPYGLTIYSELMSPDESKILELKSYDYAQVISVQNRDTLFSLPFSKTHSMSFSPDGKTVALGSTKLFAAVFDANTGKELHVLEYSKEIQCDGCNTSLRYSHDSKKIMTASPRSGVNIWNVANGKLLQNLTLQDERYSAIDFSKNDAFVYAQEDDNTLVWDVANGKEVIKCNNDDLDYIPSFSNTNTIAVASQYNTVSIWSLSQKRVVQKLQGYMNTARTDGLRYQQNNWYDQGILSSLRTLPSIDIHPNGKQLVKGKIDSIAIIFDIETGQTLHRLHGHSKQVIACVYSPDGKTIATAGGDGDIRFWNAQTGKFISLIKAHNVLIFDLAFSDDGSHIISAAWGGFYSIWKVADGKFIQSAEFPKSSPFRVKFSPKDLYVLTADVSQNLAFRETDSGEEFRKLIGHTKMIYDFDFSPDGQKVVSASEDGKVKIWDMLTGMQINKFSKHISAVNAVSWDPKDRFIASGGNDRNVYLFNPNTCEILHTLPKLSGAIAGLNFTNDGGKLIATTVEGAMHIWDMDSIQELYTYIQIDRENWLSKTPSGYFDGSPSALKNINYVSGIEVISVSRLFEQFFTPKLIKRINDGEKFSQTQENMLQKIQHAPTVAMNITGENARGINMQSDSLEWFHNTVPIEVLVTDQGGGIEELRVYNNSKLVQNLSFDHAKNKEGSIEKTMIQVQLSTGKNDLSVVAVNKERVESTPIEMHIKYDGIESDIDLFMFVIGIDDYQNPAYKLSYATKDAKSCVKQIDQGALPIYKNIYTTLLEDKKTSKIEIKAEFEKIAQKAGPEDVFIFYYAGHGTMSMGNKGQNGTFYIVPYDVTKLYGDDELLANKAVSANELLEFSKLIQARKQIFILDACQSGGALDAIQVRGASREKAIAQLARSSGTYFILASGAVQFASEAKELGHGLFTYAILEAISGKADGGLFDKKITANELKSYVEDRVPELSDQFMLTPQYPTGYSFGQDFPLVVVKE